MKKRKNMEKKNSVLLIKKTDFGLLMFENILIFFFTLSNYLQNKNSHKQICLLIIISKYKLASIINNIKQSIQSAKKAPNASKQKRKLSSN